MQAHSPANLRITRSRTRRGARTVQRVHEQLPDAVLASILGHPGAHLVSCRSEPITGSSGAVTGGVNRLVGMARLGSADVPFRVIRKAFRPLLSGRHASNASDPAHWAYWRRELLAYASTVLPIGPGLSAPRCYGVVDDVVYLADVAGRAESAEIAAGRLGAWQGTASVPDVDWLSRHQLAQRIASSNLDWDQVSADPRLVAVWHQRNDLLHELAHVPQVLVHGDFHEGNLFAAGNLTTVALDWATLGTGPVGADLAGLALSTCSDLLHPYVDGLNGRFDRAGVELGYRATLALTGASRVHWMLSQGRRPPDEYVEFVASQAP